MGRIPASAIGTPVSGFRDPRLDESFTSWLFQPYFTLDSPLPKAPYHLAGIDFAFRSLDEDAPYPHIQASHNPSFRERLIRETGLREYDVRTPLGLAEDLHSSRWGALCEYVRAFDGLPVRSQARVTWTLTKVCLHQAAADIAPVSIVDHIGESPDHAALAFVRCYARYRIHVDDARAPYEIGEFARVANMSPPGMSRIDATYQMVVQNVKHHNRLDDVEWWQRRHLEAIESSSAVLDDFERTFVMSRYHRVGGFIPQMRGQVAPLVREMDLAEAYAMELPRQDEVHRIAADEALYPVLESRTKEALWCGDKDLALERIRRAVELSPYDARAWLQLGEVYLECQMSEDALTAYRCAARFAPPGREIAWFMAGQCLEALDDAPSACDAYIASLEADPLGIAPAKRLVDLARRLGDATIQAWAQDRHDTLRQREEVTDAQRDWPYKHFPPPDAAPQPVAVAVAVAEENGEGL